MVRATIKRTRRRSGTADLLVVVVSLEVDRLTELAHALAERARDLGQALGAQHHQSDGAEEQEMDWTLDSHYLPG
jgi:hypothetical protein